MKTTNHKTTNNNAKARNRRRRIRPRTRNQGSNLHPRKVTIRLTARLSNELASIQGLIWRWGKRETISSIWEKVLMPKLREYVQPYAERAREARREAAHA